MHNMRKPDLNARLILLMSVMILLGSLLACWDREDRTETNSHLRHREFQALQVVQNSEPDSSTVACEFWGTEHPERINAEVYWGNFPARQEGAGLSGYRYIWLTPGEDGSIYEFSGEVGNDHMGTGMSGKAPFVGTTLSVSVTPLYGQGSIEGKTVIGDCLPIDGSTPPPPTVPKPPGLECVVDDQGYQMQAVVRWRHIPRQHNGADLTGYEYYWLSPNRNKEGGVEVTRGQAPRDVGATARMYQQIPPGTVLRFRISVLYDDEIVFGLETDCEERLPALHTNPVKPIPAIKPPSVAPAGGGDSSGGN